jgi:hypothetical protein
MVREADRDPRHHTQKMQTQLQETMDHLREDIDKDDEPQLKAMFETAAEVLGGLKKALATTKRKTRRHGNSAARTWGMPVSMRRPNNTSGIAKPPVAAKVGDARQHRQAASGIEGASTSWHPPFGPLVSGALFDGSGMIKVGVASWLRRSGNGWRAPISCPLLRVTSGRMREGRR